MANNHHPSPHSFLLSPLFDAYKHKLVHIFYCLLLSGTRQNVIVINIVLLFVLTILKCSFWMPCSHLISIDDTYSFYTGFMTVNVYVFIYIYIYIYIYDLHITSLCISHISISYRLYRVQYKFHQQGKCTLLSMLIL